MSLLTEPRFSPSSLDSGAKNAGYPVSTIYSDPQKSFKLQSWTHEQYGFDWGPIYGYASYGTWEFGGEIRMPATTYEQAPFHTRFPVETEQDVARMGLPDPRSAGCLPLSMEFSRLQERHGKPISIVCGGNFTIAGNLCPVEKLCRWMLKKPGSYTVLCALPRTIFSISSVTGPMFSVQNG